MNFYYCYILISEKSGKYYVGSSQDYEKRLDQHNHGYIKSTSNERPWKIIYLENFPNLSEARARELQIKGWHNRKAIERLINKGGKIVDPRSATEGRDRDENL